ncbi:pyruvate kinase [Aureococcus anophagefferens]|nr:pyruvate kinase [Aureococcus anophagefferens]
MAATVDSAMVKQCGRLAESPFPPRSDAALHKRTRIICTLGPSSWDVDMLGVLLDEGMNVARLNFSHGDHETHKRTIGRLKEALAIRPGRHCAIMLDTKGPEIRTGFFAAPNDGGKLKFAKGDPLILTTDYDHKSDGTKLGCTYKKLPTSVKPGGQILVADGSLVLEVVSTDGTAKSPARS